MQVNFVDLQKQYRSLKYEVVEELSACIEKGTFVGGYWVDLFQRNFAIFHNSDYCIGVGSGTDALLLSLLALGIGPGDEVLVPANTFIATALAVTHAGAKVVFVEADPISYTIDTNNLEKYLTKNTRAIIPVHLYGNPADMGAVMKFAKEHDLKVIEDCAQAIGAEFNDKEVGTFGDCGCFSFYPTKNLGGLAQGGAVITNNGEIAEKIESMANVGRKAGSHYEYIHLGYNSRLDAVNAIFLNKCLDEVRSWNLMRQTMASVYHHYVDSISELDRQKYAESNCSGAHVYHLYEVKCEAKEIRDALQSFLKEREIATGLHYPIPCHKQPIYREYNTQSFPVAEELSTTLLSLPMHPNLTVEQVTYVGESIKTFFSVRKRRFWNVRRHKTNN